MPHEGPQYPKDWLRVAEKDLGRVSSLLAISDPQAAGFFLQQAVEKFLKAFLLSKGWILQRTHDLEALLNPHWPICHLWKHTGLPVRRFPVSTSLIGPRRLPRWG